MAEHIWSVLCSDSIIDKDTNNISLVAVIEQIQLAFPKSGEDPVQIPMRWALVSYWRREDLDQPERQTGRLRLVDRSGTDLADAQFEIDLSAHERSRTVTKQNMLLVHRPGTHRFVVEVQQDDGSWDSVAAVPLELKDMG